MPTKTLNVQDFLAEVRVKAEVQAAKTGKLPQRWTAELFYRSVRALLDGAKKDEALLERLPPLFYWAEEFRYNTEVVDKDAALEAALQGALAPFQDQFWMFREALRCAEFRESCEKELWFKRVCYYLETKGLSGAPYFVRVSPDDPTLWLYTESEAKGKLDRQVETKLGKLLTKLLPGEKAADIQRIATYFQQAGKMELQFARTEEECVYVYKKGPSSCMSESPTVAAYASEDLAVAYVENEKGVINARAIVGLNIKQYSNVHGERDAIVPILEKNGFTKGDLEGCKLKPVSDGAGGLRYPNTDLSYGYGHFDWDAEAQTLFFKRGGAVRGGAPNVFKPPEKAAAEVAA